jgi:hypothetical protein
LGKFFDRTRSGLFERSVPSADTNCLDPQLEKNLDWTDNARTKSINNTDDTKNICINILNKHSSSFYSKYNVSRGCIDLNCCTKFKNSRSCYFKSLSMSHKASIILCQKVPGRFQKCRVPLCRVSAVPLQDIPCRPLDKY